MPLQQIGTGITWGSIRGILNSNFAEAENRVAGLEDNSEVRIGTVVPANTVGKNGDFFLRTDTNQFYEKRSGVYVLVANFGGSGISQADADIRYVNEADHTKAAHDALGIDATTIDGIDSTALQTRSERGVANGYAPLNASNQIPPTHIPPLAINDVFTVASEAAMLGLAAQRGDLAIRTDFDPDRSYMLSTDDPTLAANWVRVTFGDVVSVAGKTGVIALAGEDITSGTVSVARIGTGTKSTTTFYRGDGTFAAVPSGGGGFPLVFGVPDELLVVTGALPQVIPVGCTLARVDARVTTAPTGADIILDVNVSGTSVWTAAQRLSIPATTHQASTNIFTTSAITAGQYITVDVDQVGSIIAGANLGLTLWFTF